MENLSKALVMVGRILLVIMIIGLAMRVFNAITGSALYDVADQQNLRAYNKPFNLYDGKNNVSGSNLKTLFAKIIEHNKGYVNDDSMWINVRETEKSVDFDETLHSNEAGGAALDEYNSGIYMLMKTVWTTSKYEVYCSYDLTNGKIVCVQYRLAE